MSAETAIDILGYATTGAFTLLGLVSLRYWLRRRDRPSLWAALCFGTLALVVLEGQAVPEQGDYRFKWFLERAVIVVVLLFPYLLYRFTTAFGSSSRPLEAIAGASTLALCAWTIALPDIPDSGEPRSAGFNIYIVALLADWAFLSLIAAIRLWRAGRGQPSVARHRMRLLAFAATAMTCALFLAGAQDEENSALGLATSGLALASACAFIVGFAPPTILRLSWRRPEQDELRQATRHLMAARTPDEVIADVLPPMTRLVGARAVRLLDHDGNQIGSHLAEEWRGEFPREDDGMRVIPVPSGSLQVWTNPYAPFFGAEELELLEGLGSLTGLALDRSRLFVQEHDARVALERADEVKTNFIALAAHELRTPVTSVYGVVMTLQRLGDQLSSSDSAQLQEALRTQTERLRRLVEQLLDLSRLDAEAVPIDPVPLPVRERVQEMVEAAAGAQASEVEVEISGELETVVDPTVLERVVSNLVTNALRHGEAPIRVTAVQNERHFRLAVEDCGGGVPPNFVEELFERFSRSDEARSRGIGSGLGLSIARSYAQAHGGDLLYEPGRPQGARFELVVPNGAVSAHSMRHRPLAGVRR